MKQPVSDNKVMIFTSGRCLQTLCRQWGSAAIVHCLTGIMSELSRHGWVVWSDVTVSYQEL